MMEAENNISQRKNPYEHEGSIHVPLCNINSNMSSKTQKNERVVPPENGNLEDYSEPQKVKRVLCSKGDDFEINSDDRDLELSKDPAIQPTSGRSEVLSQSNIAVSRFGRTGDDKTLEGFYNLENLIDEQSKSVIKTNEIIKHDGDSNGNATQKQDYVYSSFSQETESSEKSAHATEGKDSDMFEDGYELEHDGNNGNVDQEEDNCSDSDVFGDEKLGSDGTHVTQKEDHFNALQVAENGKETVDHIPDMSEAWYEFYKCLVKAESVKVGRREIIFVAISCRKGLPGFMFIITPVGVNVCDMREFCAFLVLIFLLMTNVQKKQVSELKVNRNRGMINKKSRLWFSLHCEGGRFITKRGGIKNCMPHLFEMRTNSCPAFITVCPTRKFSCFDELLFTLMMNPNMRGRQLMCHEWMRYSTLGSLDVDVSVSLGRMSRQGLYYDGRGHIVCYSCDRHTPTNCIQTNRLHTQECRHQQVIDDANVPIWREQQTVRNQVQTSTGNVAQELEDLGVMLRENISGHTQARATRTIGESSTPDDHGERAIGISQGTFRDTYVNFTRNPARQSETSSGATQTNGATGSSHQHCVEEILAENKELRRKRICKICKNDRVAAVFLPCGHLVCCIVCGQWFKDKRRKCFICRSIIKDIVWAVLP